jgi:hypothetical protein
MSETRWTPEENAFLMEYAHRVPWKRIADTLGRTELACKAHFEKIVRLRKNMGTWKGL